MTLSTLHDSRQAAAALAAALLGTIRLAHGLIEADRQVDLTGLDNSVGLLCARTLDLPPDQGRQLRPELCQVAQAIDALTDSLRAHTPPP